MALALVPPVRRTRRAARRVRRYAPRHLAAVPAPPPSAEDVAVLYRVLQGLQALPAVA